LNPAPAWFTDALARLPEHADAHVDGTTIHYRRWGDPDRPGLVLVHGGAAHSGWWDHVAPLLAGEYCVVAPDLSGHGDSDRRDQYHMETWAREVIAVAQHSCLPAPPIIVAHSMGGWVGITVAAHHGDALAGLILLDSTVHKADPEVEAARVGVAFGRLRVYPTLEEALRRFRTVPDQPTSLPYVIDHVARTSLREVPGGYTWKFDPKIFDNRSVPHGETLQRVRRRVALFRAEHGLVSKDIGAYMYDQLGRVAPIVEVPLAWHHIMLDQPLPLVTGLRALLADWEHSTPQRRE
jgi:pimeloyl-ACP methyl ester carboxylesterase